MTFPGILYEPRAFWSIGRVATATGSGQTALGVPRNVVRFPEQDFFNGEKYPVTLTKLVVAPVGFWWDRLNAPPIQPNFRSSGIGQLEYCRVQISAPQRQYYSRFPISGANYSPVPSWHPATGLGTPAYSSGYIGASRWDFDHEMIIPQKGFLEIEFGSYLNPGWFGAAMPPVDIRVGVYERGGLLNGNARVSQQVNRPTQNVQPVSSDGLGGPLPPSNAPWGPDAFGFSTVGVDGPRWPARTTQGRAAKFTGRAYDQQNVSSAGSTPVSGFVVAVDQQALDDTFFGVPQLNGVVAPLAFNLPVRARMQNGGTKQWWWRPGAPLALVCPTMTPANVYVLPEPITLAPGDQLNVELEVPERFLDGQGNPIDTVYQLGVSLCGEAAIEA